MSIQQKNYVGRAEGIVPVTVFFSQYTYNLLTTLAPNKKARSAFLTQLVHSYESQQVERLQWREKLTTLLLQQSET